MPSSSQHVITVKTISSPDARFNANDCGEEEVSAGDFDDRVTRAPARDSVAAMSVGSMMAELWTGAAAW